eukprot:TRINITY_DN8517_c0_g1_i1.p1 TRINITY_DN8517_c0_g1~~TRINITY_DN8517_c0_g1_i1.p1  ORF type:complete len:265 (+),score=45.48 TRINITY_DN8517_c0_g1_i1:63-797(+)
MVDLLGGQLHPHPGPRLLPTRRRPLPPGTPVLLVVPGSGSDGSDTPGLWSSVALLNKHGPERATVVPYVRRAHAAGWAVLVANPNRTHREGRRVPSTVPESPAAHLTTLWRWLHGHRTVSHVLVVAHSQGGAAVAALLASGVIPGSEVTGMALLDSVHRAPHTPALAELGPRYRHWVASSQPLDSPNPKPWLKAGAGAGTRCYSAGVPEHALVPAAAIDSALAFLGSCRSTGTALEAPHSTAIS